MVKCYNTVIANKVVAVLEKEIQNGKHFQRFNT